MTPINFVSFLLSLVVVDLEYSYMRVRNHTEASGRLPTLLHHIIFRSQPYATDIRVRSQGPHHYEEEVWHYHTKQGRIMKLEAEEAFRGRNRIIIFLAVFLAIITWVLWHLAKVLYRRWYS